MRKTIIIILMGLSATLLAQQEGLYTQYMYNTSGINAGYTGLREIMSLYLQHRNQWSGLDGAPQTSTVGVETSIPSKNLGLGFLLNYDEIGPIATTKAVFNTAYHLQINEIKYVSLGIKVQASAIDFDYALLHSYNQEDQFLVDEINNDVQVDWGVGMMFHSSSYFVGLSASNLLRNSYFMNDATKDISNNSMHEIHYYAIAGGVTRLNHDITLKPGLLLTKTDISALRVGVSVNAMYQQLIVAGVSWQVESALSWLMGVYITPGIFAGYSHDFDTTPFRTTHSGTNEVFLRFDINTAKRNAGKINLPRFF